MDDSDDDDNSDEKILKSMDDAEDKDPSRKLAPEDAERQGELADSINRIHVGQVLNKELKKSLADPKPVEASPFRRSRQQLDPRVITKAGRHRYTQCSRNTTGS